MMKKTCFILFFVLVVSVLFAQQDARDAANDALSRMGNALDKRETLAIWPVIPKGFETSEALSLETVQSRLSYNFTRYSNFRIFDLQNMEIVMNAQDIMLRTGRFDDEGPSITGFTNYQYILIPTIIKINDTEFEFDFNINTLEGNEGKAHFREYTKDKTWDNLDLESIINKGTDDLLRQLDIKLEDAQKQELLKTEILRAQSRSKEAFDQDNWAEGLYWDMVSKNYRPFAERNTNDSSTAISTILKDFEERDEWLNIFKNCAMIFDKYYPFEIIYDPILSVESNNYPNKTVNLSAKISRVPSNIHFSLINNLLSDLEKTGKRKEWNFDGWPLESDEPHTVILHGKEGFGTYSIELAIFNEKEKQISSQKIYLRGNNVKFSRGDKKIDLPAAVSETVVFNDVRISDVTESISFKIVSINGENTEDIIRSNKITIRKDPDLTDRLLSREGIEEKNGTITDYSGKTRNVIIPEMMDSAITAIGPQAFENKKILKVSIPNTVNVIEKRAFYNNNLKKLIIPNKVSRIGEWAFSKNNLFEVTIPSGVKNIEDWAFFRNKIKKITIPGNVNLGNNSFDDNFAEYYQGVGKSSGIYKLDDRGRWTKN
jgi:hypothetical protein